MASPLLLPSIDELVSAFHASVRARRDRRADGHDGSAYDCIARISAALWSREAQRDADLFRAIYLDNADAQDLTARAAHLYGIDRVLGTAGEGFATLARPTAGAEATVWTGSRLGLAAGLTDSIAYSVARDVPVQATDLYAIVPIRATRTGPGAQVRAGIRGAYLDAPLWDRSWYVRSLTCEDGTRFEPAREFRARVRDERRAERTSYEPRIVRACSEAGAAHVALFRSDHGESDHGLNACHVGDAGYSGSRDLVRRVTVALEAVRVCGADLPVRPLAAASLELRATIALWDDPGHFHLGDVEQTLRAALLAGFEATSAGFTYPRDGLAGTLARVSDAIESVTCIAPAADLPILQSSQFPAVLTRLSVRPSDVFFTFTGPA